jgi:hypothetical protein
MKILVNHLGYDARGPKSAVIQIEGSDRGAGLSAGAACGLLDCRTGVEVFSGRAGEPNGVLRWKDWRFARFDFSGFELPGSYLIRTAAPGGTADSAPFEIADRLVPRRTLSDILHYFKSQRASGRYDRADREVPFFGGHEGTVDVHGGWYDASGDLSKYLSHLSYANTMNPQQTPIVVWCLLEGLERLKRTDERLAAALEDRVLQEALYGADFLMRMQDPSGYFYTTVFDVWSHDPGRRAICSFSTQKGILSAEYRAGFRQGGGAAIAALARMSRRGLEADHAPAAYLAAAEKGFRHLQGHSLEYLPDGRENIIDDYCALLAACELLAATGRDEYRSAARGRAENLASRISRDESFAGWWRADDPGELPYFHAAEAGLPVLALIRFLQTAPENPSAAAAREAIRASLAFELEVTREVFNPFGYARQYCRPSGGAKRASFFIPHANPSGYWWQGEDARIASLAAAARAASLLPLAGEGGMVPALKEYAADQMNWILGLNPYDACMLQGKGRNNPEYEWGWFNAPGGIANGITSGFRDEEDIDFLPEEVAHDGMHRWRWSEQWIPHAAWFFLAACMEP